MSLSNFEILSKLGDGAYSTVYKVKRLEDGNTYALKKVKMQNLNKKEKKNALNEVRILASIHHPNIISYKEVFFDESGFLCLVMEYADNGDLYQKIVKYQRLGKFLSEKNIWKIFTQVTRGLKALHDLNILHRDMKSANVFLNKNGTVKLGDMNVSKVAKNGLLYTQTGTPYYASPEVWQDKPYSLKSDIWSLGCVLYETTTLYPPFRAEDMQGLYEKVIRGEFAAIQSNYSKDLRMVIRQLLQIEPTKRPSCAQILGSSAVKKRFSTVDEESLEKNVLIDRIKANENLAEVLPRPNYEKNSYSEMPSISKSPSKSLKIESSKSFIGRNFKYQEKERYKIYKENKKDSHVALKLPKIKYLRNPSPVPIRKLREIEEFLSMPKSLPANNRLKKLRDAYLGKPFKLFLN